MDAIVAERPSREISAQAETPSFLFSSPHFAIEAYGVFERIRTPAVGGGGADSVLQAAVDAALARARRAGQENPIVVGAIPFDSRQPSFLFAPKTHRISAPRVATSAPEAKADVPALWYRSVPGQRGFEEAVAKAVATFRDGHASKAVLSRILEIEFAERVDAVAILEYSAPRIRRLSFPCAAARWRRSARREPRAADPQDRRLHPLQSVGRLGEARRGIGRGRVRRASSPAIEQG